jgi:hypothetical protein
MAMTKKDFERIAQVFRVNQPFSGNGSVLWANLRDDACIEFKAGNPRFDEARFKAACEPQSGKQMALKGV